MEEKMCTTTLVQNFSSEEFGNVRVVMKNGIPWFVAADVCRVLELTNPTVALERLDDDEKMTLNTTEGHSGQRGGAQMMNTFKVSGFRHLCRKMISYPKTCFIV